MKCAFELSNANLDISKGTYTRCSVCYLNRIMNKLFFEKRLLDENNRYLHVYCERTTRP
jgi:hypothetical protein